MSNETIEIGDIIAEKLNVHDGDIILVRGNPEVVYDAGWISRLQDTFQERDLGRCLFLFGSTDMSIESLSEEDMRKGGWVRDVEGDSDEHC